MDKRLKRIEITADIVLQELANTDNRRTFY